MNDVRVVIVDDIENLPWCACAGARKPPLGWTFDYSSKHYVCSECRKPSRPNYERTCVDDQA